MRASLRAHLLDAVRQGRAPQLLRTGARAAAARLGVRLPRRADGPMLATFAVTWRCPLACAMCDLPARAGAEIPDAEIPRWIDAICDLRPAGLGFTGGEPLLRSVVYDAIEQAASRGVVTHLNTSGLPVTEQNAARLAGSGVASINVSIDHDDPRRHDELRRRDGSHAAALDAVGRLAAARDRAGARFRLQVMMAVSAQTLDRVGPLQRAAVAAGADALSVLPVHDFDGDGDAGALPVDADPFAGIPLENSRAYLDGVIPFLRGEPTPIRCTAPRTALFIDPRGHLFACTPASTERRDGIPARPEDLATLFRSGRLSDTVPDGRCERCWWNCHRELDIAIGVLSDTRSPAR